MTEQTQPTDAEILDAADDFRSQYKHGGTTFDEFNALGFARAVLAKWGTPAGAGEPVAWMSRLPSGSEVFARTKDFYPDAVPVYLAPQPTQAGALPLTSEQERAIREAYESAGSESYLGARPQIDTNERRRVFKAGFERGWAAKTGADHG